MPHDQHQRDSESSRWEPNPPDYWPNTSNPDPEKRDPVPGDPDPTMPPPERRRNRRISSAASAPAEKT